MAAYCAGLILVRSTNIAAPIEGAQHLHRRSNIKSEVLKSNSEATKMDEEI